MVASHSRLSAQPAATAVLLGLLVAVGAQATEQRPLSAVRAEGRIEGRTVPDIPLKLADGRKLTLSELAEEQALLVTLYYRRCTGICTPFLMWIDNATRDVGGLGQDYQVLALSFDNADTAADLRAQARTFGLLDNPDWHFAVTGRNALAQFGGALEFWYQRRPDSDQYDHNSLLVAIRDRRVVRALSGGPGQTQRLRELVWELRGRIMPYYPVDDGPVLRCLAFDASTGTVHVDWGMLLLVAPALAALTAVLALFRPGRRRVTVHGPGQQYNLRR